MAKTIVLTKFGWERSASEDFIDDGNYFAVYRNPNYPELRMSKCKPSDDGYYISIHLEDGDLTYEEMRDIDGYYNLDDFNNGSYPSKEDVDKLLNEGCKKFHENYLKAKESLEPVDINKVIQKIVEERDAAVKMYTEARQLVEDNLELIVDNGDGYFSGHVFSRLRSLKRNILPEAEIQERANRIMNSGRRYAKNVSEREVRTNDYYYTSIKEDVAEMQKLVERRNS